MHKEVFDSDKFRLDIDCYKKNFVIQHRPEVSCCPTPMFPYYLLPTHTFQLLSFYSQDK